MATAEREVNVLAKKKKKKRSKRSVCKTQALVRDIVLHIEAAVMVITTVVCAKDQRVKQKGLTLIDCGCRHSV